MFLEKGGACIAFGKFRHKGRKMAGYRQGLDGACANTGMVVIVFAWQTVVVVVGAVLGKSFAVMQGKKFEKAGLRIFQHVRLVMSGKHRQLGKHVFYRRRHDGREQVEEE